MERPVSIRHFELSYLAALAVSLLSSALTWSAKLSVLHGNSATAALGDGFMTGSLAVAIAGGAAVNLLLWWLVARRASIVAAWFVVGFFAIGTIFLLLSIVKGTIELGTTGVMTLAVYVLQGVAVATLFRPDARAWLGAR